MEEKRWVMMKRLPPHVLLILAAIFWGGNFVIGRAVANDVPPFILSFLRWVVAFFIMLPLVWPNLKNELPKIRKHFNIVFLSGLTGIAGFNTFVYIALHYTTSINASLMNTTTPIVIFILSYFFLQERLTHQQWIGAFLSLVGVLFLISRGSLELIKTLSFNVGDILMLFAVLSWSVYSLLTKRYANELPVNTTFFATIAVGAVILFPFFLYEWLIKHETIAWNVGTISAILYVGIFASVAAFLSWNSGVVKLGASKAGVFLNLVPLFAAFFAVLFIGETVTISQLGGALFVLSGVYLASKKRNAARSRNVSKHI